MFPTPMATVSWSSADPDRWELRTVTPDGAISPLVSVWPDPHPPTLLARYDALAGMGFNVLEGGADAWMWNETLTDEGDLLLVASTGIRPLTADTQQDCPQHVDS